MAYGDEHALAKNCANAVPNYKISEIIEHKINQYLVEIKRLESIRDRMPAEILALTSEDLSSLLSLRHIF
jgi:hypothetical protein